MKSAGLLTVLILAILEPGISMKSEAVRYPLYVGDPTCACINTKKDTLTVAASEITAGGESR